jgi:sulfate transport system permease protein
VVLSTARALGEIGAVLVVSSLVAGQTLTLPLLVFQRDSQPGSDAVTGAYAAATELAIMSLVVLLAMTLLGPRRKEAKCGSTSSPSPSGSATSPRSTTSRSKCRGAR